MKPIAPSPTNPTRDCTDFLVIGNSNTKAIAGMLRESGCDAVGMSMSGAGMLQVAEKMARTIKVLKCVFIHALDIDISEPTSMYARADKMVSSLVCILISERISKRVKVRRAYEFLVWSELNPSFFGLDAPMMIGAIYIPPESSPYITENDNYFHILTEKVLSELNQGQNVIICGDMNARTGNCDDFAAADTDECDDWHSGKFHLTPNSNTKSVCENFKRRRVSKDKVLNNYGKELLELCKMTNMRIVNGRAGEPDNTGRCTCHTYNGQSVVDYVISDAQGTSRIYSMVIEDITPESDHSPIVFTLSSQSPNISTKQSVPHIAETQMYKSFKSNALNTEIYKQALRSRPCQEFQESE